MVVEALKVESLHTLCVFARNSGGGAVQRLLLLTENTKDAFVRSPVFLNENKSGCNVEAVLKAARVHGALCFVSKLHTKSWPSCGKDVRPCEARVHNALAFE